MSLSIHSIGTAVPECSMEQSQAIEFAQKFCGDDRKHTRILQSVYRNSGISRRGSVLLNDAMRFYSNADGFGPGTAERMQVYAEKIVELAAGASRKALGAAGIDPGRISHLITVSCTGFFAPGLDVALIDSLTLAPSTRRIQIGFMGCHGALNGLQVASSIAQAEPGATVLLCATELCSLHFQYGWDNNSLVANALFADGAAALVASQNGPAQWKVASSASVVLPDSRDAMSWRIGDHGFEMTLSPEVPALIARHLRPWTENWLSRHDLTLNDVRSWAVHPGGPRILDSVVSGLGLPEQALDVSRHVLAEHGNMSSPTILFVLEKLRLEQAERPCVALAFGPGLVVEAALLL